MKKIPLTQGKFALVDDDIFEYLNQWKWYAIKSKNTFYARRSIKNPTSSIIMHRFILNVHKNKQVDHINGNGLDNRVCNLRVASNGQNQANKKTSIKNKSGFKGVTFLGKKFKSQIKYNGVVIYLGIFKTPEEAHEAYKQAAIKYHGEFARW